MTGYYTVTFADADDTRWVYAVQIYAESPAAAVQNARRCVRDTDASIRLGVVVEMPTEPLPFAPETTQLTLCSVNRMPAGLRRF